MRIRGLQAAYRSRVDSMNPIIEQMLRDEEQDFEVRKWSVHILGTTDPRKYKRTIRRKARDASEDLNLRKEAIFALTESDDDRTLGALCALLGDTNPEIRKSVAWALSKISSPDTINCLLAALEDDEESVRDWAIRGLRDMDDSRALEKLAEALVNSPPEEQVRMVRLVVEKRSEVILRALVVLLDSRSVEVRRVAAWAMGVSPYPPAVPSLKPLLEDSDGEVRDYARIALIRSGGLDPADLHL
ncbi:HEAT repeat domain-containing protein [Candidatus Thorarchaeota archaeon]|nr:MAG: HEAT repeat domain-containing protein [Candidatus Thorarchaeota archaeon]